MKHPFETPGAILNLDAARFRSDFDRRDFPITHSLTDNHLFSLPRIVELARTIAVSRPHDVYYDAGDIEVGQRWADSPKIDLAVDETVKRIETSNAWIILRQVDLVAGYSEILQSCIQDVLRISGSQLRERMKRTEIILFVTSPNRVTTYHIDRECSFLLQLRGEKNLSVFNRDDRDILPEEELERFWTVDNNAARYKPTLQGRANVYRLRAGEGVHIPVNAPHWLKNDDNVSISVNINFWANDSERANLYRANHYLRRVGFKPTAPFASPRADILKNAFGATAYAARQTLQRLRR